MIYGNINSSTSELIKQMPALRSVLSYLSQNDLQNLAVGQYDIENGIFAKVQTYNTKSEADGRWESHKKYLDFQYIVSGTEYIRVTKAEGLSVKQNMLAEKDALYYEKAIRPVTSLILEAGDYVAMAPEDAHEACLDVKHHEPVKKIVFKVPIALIN